MASKSATPVPASVSWLTLPTLGPVEKGSAVPVSVRIRPRRWHRPASTTSTSDECAGDGGNSVFVNGENTSL